MTDLCLGVLSLLLAPPTEAAKLLASFQGPPALIAPVDPEILHTASMKPHLWHRGALSWVTVTAPQHGHVQGIGGSQLSQDCFTGLLSVVIVTVPPLSSAAPTRAE